MEVGEESAERERERENDRLEIERQRERQRFEHDVISEESTNSDNEESNRLGLEEEQGLFTGHAEVVVPPEYETDEDRPIAGAEPPFDQIIAEMDGKDRDGRENQKERGRGVGQPTVMHSLMDGSSDDSDGNDSFSVHNRQIVHQLENPLDFGQSVSYPPGDPPAYTSDDDLGPSANKAGGRPPINNVILGSVTQPFQKFASEKTRMVAQEESADDDDDRYGSEGEEPIYPGGHAPLMQELMNQPEGDYKQSKWYAELDSDQRLMVSYFTGFDIEPLPIETHFYSFHVEMIPAVGDLDPFIKVPRPDEVDDNNGLTYLDEPAVVQSDPVIVDMQMRTTVKDVDKAPEVREAVPMKKLERADRNTKQIDDWINNIKDLHRSRPPTNVHYSKGMPDVEKLMQEFPPNVEKALKDITLPTAELDVPLETYVDIVLNILDIPVQKSRIESLHALFSLYAEFKNSQHFRGIGQGTRSKPSADRLEL